MTDLWPTDLGTVTTKSPLTILKEQASLLGTKTKNIVKARVEKFNLEGYSFNYDFILQAPALDNYTYRLFRISYDVDLYPVRFLLDQAISAELGLKSQDARKNQPLVASDEDSFIAALGRVLQLQKTRNVVHAIMSQSMDLGQENGSPSD